MSGEQFLRAHGWKLGRGLWWHDRLPDAGHQFEVAVLQQAEWLALRLAEADGLWRYWCNHDITANDDLWADFTNAVLAHLDGDRVPQRFIDTAREKRSPTTPATAGSTPRE